MSKRPRIVRNFWLEALIDGRRSRLVGGPRAKDGGMSLTLYQRSGGSVVTAVEICCRYTMDGLLVMEVASVATDDRLSTKKSLRVETIR